MFANMIDKKDKFPFRVVVQVTRSIFRNSNNPPSKPDEGVSGGVHETIERAEISTHVTCARTGKSRRIH